MKYIFILIGVGLLAFSSCKNNDEESVKALMEGIRSEYAMKRYDKCLADIDTLRSRFPKAIEERREALDIYQKASLEQTQQLLAKADSALTVVSSEYTTKKAAVEAHKAAGIATAEELNALTFLRMHRDSLQVQFDVLCAKIKYIHKRQKQL